MAHHFILESLVRGASQNGTGSDLMKELGQAIERCHFELCAKDAQVAAGIIEDLMDQIRRSAAIADDATS